jgi:hypothetical protein
MMKGRKYGQIEQENIRSQEKIAESAKTGVFGAYVGNRKNKAKSQNPSSTEAVATTEAFGKVGLERAGF